MFICEEKYAHMVDTLEDLGAMIFALTNTGEAITKEEDSSLEEQILYRLSEKVRAEFDELHSRVRDVVSTS